MTGIILAGGKSRRMGTNKAFIDSGGVPLFERVYRVVKEIFSEIIIVTNDVSSLLNDMRPFFKGTSFRTRGPLGACTQGFSIHPTIMPFVLHATCHF